MCLSLSVQVQRIGQTFIATAPWHPEPIEGTSWHEVYWAIMKARMA